MTIKAIIYTPSVITKKTGEGISEARISNLQVSFPKKKSESTTAQEGSCFYGYYLALTKTHFEVNLAFYSSAKSVVGTLLGFAAGGGVLLLCRTKCVDPGIDFHV